MQRLLPTYLDPNFISKRCTSEFWSSILITPFINLEKFTTLLGESFFLTTITPEDYRKVYADFLTGGNSGIFLRAEINRMHIIAKITNCIDSLIKEEKAKIIKGNIITVDEFLNVYRSINRKVSKELIEEQIFVEYIQELKLKHENMDIVVNPEDILLSLIKHVNHEFLEKNVLSPSLMEVLQKKQNEIQSLITTPPSKQEETPTIPQEITKQYIDAANVETKGRRKYLLALLDAANGMNNKDISVKYWAYAKNYNHVSAYIRKGYEIAKSLNLPPLDDYLKKTVRIFQES